MVYLWRHQKKEKYSFSYLSSGASSWFCGTCHWPPEQASCRSCWWVEGAVWVWGPGSSTRANLQRTSGYLSYLMRMYNAHTHTHRHTRVKKALSMKKSCLLISMHLKMSSAWPASAGWNGPDPVRFFTGRAGTLQQKRQKDSGLTEQQHRGRFQVKFDMFRCLCIFLNETIWGCGTIWGYSPASWVSSHSPKRSPFIDHSPNCRLVCFENLWNLFLTISSF